jgi:serine/threonine protein kinase
MKIETLDDVHWLKREVEILKKVAHKNVISYKEMFENADEINIILERFTEIIPDQILTIVE